MSMTRTGAGSSSVDPRPQSAMRGSTVAVGLLLIATVIGWSSSASAQTLPSDAQETAPVPATTFASWFVSGTPTLDGVVRPANSVTFPNDPGLKNVDFYQWSEQMFLWLTSPAPGTTGGGGRIFSSAGFFDVSLPDASGNFTLVPHVAGQIPSMNLRAAEPGPNGFPVIKSRAGKLFEIHPSRFDAAGKSLLMNEEGKAVAIGQALIDGGKPPVFLDLQGKKVENAKPIIPGPVDDDSSAQEVVTDNQTVFLDSSGNVIEVAIGQAQGNGVLLTQNGSLIYYSTVVNDVFAYFRTGKQNGRALEDMKQFPTKQSELDRIIAFAGLPGPNQKTFAHPEALCIEVKASWVEAAKLPDATGYIKMTATVPTFDTTNPKKWVENGQKTVLLAMVGMHVVGSAKGHPEMIWATFEHVGNSPNAAYTYNPKAGPNPKTVAEDTTGTWLFSRTPPVAPFNRNLQKAIPGGIISKGFDPIAPSDTIRQHPFGASSDKTPNPLVGSVAESNTQIISINNSVRGQIANGDVRKNYLFLGATWTIGGNAPTGDVPSPSGNVVGASQLSNSTMETYQQGSATFGSMNSCFQCHLGNDTGVSHIYPKLRKLF